MSRKLKIVSFLLVSAAALSAQPNCGWFYPGPIAAKGRAAITSMNSMMNRAIAKGVIIGLGTDASVYPHGRNAEEFGHLVEMGMKPLDALRAGTSVNARLLGIAAETGTLEGAVAVAAHGDHRGLAAGRRAVDVRAV